MKLHITRRFASGLVLGVGSVAVAVLNRAWAAPAERPLLTVSGKIDGPAGSVAMKFDRSALEALGTASFTTKTPWYPDPVTFEGVPMSRLMSAVGASGETIVATALNDYVTEIPISDFEKYKVLLALKRDGQYMPTRDKGPLFIVYPFDSEPALQHQRYYSRSAWQVASIVVR